MGGDRKEWKDFYNGKLKWQKIGTSTEKQDFVKMIMAKDWKPENFKRFSTHFQGDKVVTTKDWISWVQMKDRESIGTLKIAIAKGRIQKRPHELLEPSDEGYDELDDVDKFQYRYVKMSDLLLLLVVRWW